MKRDSARKRATVFLSDDKKARKFEEAQVVQRYLCKQWLTRTCTSTVLKSPCWLPQSTVLKIHHQLTQQNLSDSANSNSKSAYSSKQVLVYPETKAGKRGKEPREEEYVVKHLKLKHME